MSCLILALRIARYLHFSFSIYKLVWDAFLEGHIWRDHSKACFQHLCCTLWSSGVWASRRWLSASIPFCWTVDTCHLFPSDCRNLFWSFEHLICQDAARSSFQWFGHGKGMFKMNTFFRCVCPESWWLISGSLDINSCFSLSIESLILCR